MKTLKEAADEIAESLRKGGMRSEIDALCAENARLHAVIKWLQADLEAIHTTAAAAIDTARLQPRASVATPEPAREKEGQ